MAAAGASFTAVAQQFSTASGQTATGYLGLFGKKVGNGADLLCQLYTVSSSLPSAIASSVTCILPADFWPTSNGWVYLPMPVTGLTASTSYMLVVSTSSGYPLPGDASDYISLEKSNQVSGTATSTGGTYTAQAYGLMYRMFDQAGAGALTFVCEDVATAPLPRWTWLGYDALGDLTNVNEYTVAEGAGAMRSARSATLVGGQLGAWA